MFSLLQRIQRPICLFLDKLEEPFNRYFYKIPGTNTVADGRYNASLWAYAQLAFAEAVYRLYSGRHHIKIFYGIRQEALFGCENITRESTKILSMVTKLNYTYSDLREMCRIYIKQESHENLMLPDLAETNPFKALCGIDTVMHRSGKPEHIWAYIYRHSLQRPRDIMEMALALYENTVHAPDLKKNDENALTRICRHWINEISTRQCMDYLTGLEPFMALEENIAFTQNIMNFLKYLPTMFLPVIQYCSTAIVAMKTLMKLNAEHVKIYISFQRYLISDCWVIFTKVLARTITRIILNPLVIAFMRLQHRLCQTLNYTTPTQGLVT